MQGYSRDFVQSALKKKIFYLFFVYYEKKNLKEIFLSSGGTVYGIQEEQPIKESSLANQSIIMVQ